MNATATTTRFYAARAEGRYRVIDGAIIDARQDGDAPGAAYVATCASRAKAEERAAKLNEAAADPRITTDPAELAVLMAAAAALDALPTDEEPEEDAPSAPLAVVTLDGEETTVEVTATPVRTVERVALGSLPERRPAKKAAAPKAKETGEPVKSLWVAAAFVPIILADTAPERASLVAKLDASIPNNRGGRTVRLTRAEAEELAAIGTEIETAAIEAGGRDAGRLAHSAVTMRARLAALWS